MFDVSRLDRYFLLLHIVFTSRNFTTFYPYGVVYKAEGLQALREAHP